MKKEKISPDKFTISQLRKHYETIHDKSYDKRNFSRKLFSMDLLEKLEEKEKKSSRRGAWYYRINSHKYECLLKHGFNLSNFYYLSTWSLEQCVK